MSRGVLHFLVERIMTVQVYAFFFLPVLRLFLEVFHWVVFRFFEDPFMLIDLFLLTDRLRFLPRPD